MGAKEEKEVSEEGGQLYLAMLVDRQNRVTVPGARGPAVSFEGEKTTINQAEDESGVSVDMD